MLWKKFLFQARMRWGLIRKAKPRPVLPYAEVKTIGILLGQDVPAAKELIDSLKKDGKQLHTLRYLTPSQANALPSWSIGEQRRSFSSKALSNWGLLTNQAIQNFLSHEYDILINTSLQRCPYLEQVQLRCNTRMKASICEKTTQMQNYHLLIQSNEHKQGISCMYAYIKHTRN